MNTTEKNPAAVALGRKGGTKNSQAQADARKRNLAAANAARLKKIGSDLQLAVDIPSNVKDS